MISINLNAMQEWERVRRDTSPRTRDVDPNPGTEDTDRPELDDGSHGVRIVRHRSRDQGEPSKPDQEESDAYEVDIGHEEKGYGPPPDGSKAPIEPYQGQNVDVET